MKNTRLLFVLMLSLLMFSHCKEQAKEKNNVPKVSVEEINQDYLKKGLDIALATKAVLGKNLFTAIGKNGTENALEFCSEKAIVLTDSMANQLNAKIKRVSDKNRNPTNNANELELEYINWAKNELSENGKVSPKIKEINNQFVGYYPILTDNLCLQCHGNVQNDISKTTWSKIQRLYPNDRATGYGVNELRGIWVVTMNK